MEITNKTELLEFIRKESLKLIKENQASPIFDELEEKLSDVNEYFVETDEKRLAKLNSEEEKAIEGEEYATLQGIKEEKYKVLGKLMVAYQKKMEIYSQLRNAIKQELSDLGAKGSGVFKDKKLTEFSNETFPKNNTVKITTVATEITIQKISDNNQYKVINSTAPSIEAGDILAVPNIQVGSSAKLVVYRQFGDKFEEVGRPMIQNVREIIKNPS